MLLLYRSATLTSPYAINWFSTNRHQSWIDTFIALPMILSTCPVGQFHSHNGCVVPFCRKISHSHYDSNFMNAYSCFSWYPDCPVPLCGHSSFAWLCAFLLPMNHFNLTPPPMFSTLPPLVSIHEWTLWFTAHRPLSSPNKLYFCLCLYWFSAFSALGIEDGHADMDGHVFGPEYGWPSVS